MIIIKNTLFSEGNTFKGIYLSKALTYTKFVLYKQKCFFIKETDTFGRQGPNVQISGRKIYIYNFCL